MRRNSPPPPKPSTPLSSPGHSRKSDFPPINILNRARGALLALGLLVSWSASAYADRLPVELAKDWKFTKKDAGAAAATAGWDGVTVPHTWNNMDVQQSGRAGVAPVYFRGPCWYARSLDVPAAWQGKRVFIRFEAASIVAQVYLNGQLLGAHRGAFTAFCFELTPQLKFGQANELRVRVDNTIQADVPPLSGDFNMDGGIYRPVQLLVTDDVCVSPLDSASPGVYNTIKTLDVQHARVEVKSLISNGAATEQSPQIETIIKDADGTVVAQHTQAQTIASGKTLPSTETLDIASPHLWNGIKDPHLYSVTVRVHRGNDVVDEVVQPLGLRTVAITQAQGFLLNNKPYPIHGVSRHQDRRDQGWALSAADHKQDMDMILDMGVTAVRNTHYPQSGTWHDLGDRAGMLMWNEVSNVRTINDTPAYTAGAQTEVREMVLQLYNHPSVAFWGLFNELDNLPTPPPAALLTKLKADITGLDTSRVIVAAADKMNRAYNTIPDWTCYNTYPGWYGPAEPGPDPIIAQFSKEIGKRMALSEYGAGGNPLQHQEGPIKWIGARAMASGPSHPEEYQAAVHEADYAQIIANPNLWGSFIWCMFDFGSSQKNEGGTIGINDKGMVTMDRAIKKDVYFFYQANWSETPMVYITSRRNTDRTLATTEIKIYSNLPTVQLKVNGKELPAVQGDKVHVFRWENVTLQKGDNQIEATASGGGKTLSDHCAWMLK